MVQKKKVNEVTLTKLMLSNQIVGYRIRGYISDGSVEVFDFESSAVPESFVSVLPSSTNLQEQLIEHNGLLVTQEELDSGVRVRDTSKNKARITKLLESYIKRVNAQRSFATTGGNPQVGVTEESQFNRLKPLMKKHIFTKSYGDGQIESITRKNDLSGLWVYFYTNWDEVPFDRDKNGCVKIDAEVFLSDIESIRELL